VLLQAWLLRQKHRDKTIGKFGEMHNGFKRGSLIEFACGFRFYWRENGMQKNKAFSFGTIRTREMAYMLANDVRNEIYPLSNKELFEELPFAQID
jgi:hypothetical protein